MKRSILFLKDQSLTINLCIPSLKWKTKSKSPFLRWCRKRSVHSGEWERKDVPLGYGISIFLEKKSLYFLFPLLLLIPSALFCFSGLVEVGLFSLFLWDHLHYAFLLLRLLLGSGVVSPLDFSIAILSTLRRLEERAPREVRVALVYCD